MLTASSNISATFDLTYQVSGNIIFMFQTRSEILGGATSLTFVPVSLNGTPITSMPSNMMPSTSRFSQITILVGTTYTPVYMYIAVNGVITVSNFDGTAFSAGINVLQWQVQYSTQ
jgi:hypothetical protein